MKFSNLFSAIVLVLGCALCAAAQESKCALKPSQSPEIRGLRLGMTPAQVTARFPQLRLGTANDFGQSKAFLDSNYLAQIVETAFQGVDSISLNFIDNRLVELGVGYATLPWRDLNQFVEKFSELVKLPKGWKEGENPLTLDCAGLQVHARSSTWSKGGMSPYITFKELGAEDVLAERTAKKNER